jgi:hypothetical protein
MDIETFPNPNQERHYTIQHIQEEFTSTCPMTGHPDYATVVFSYAPDEVCIEDAEAFAPTSWLRGSKMTTMVQRPCRLDVDGSVQVVALGQHRISASLISALNYFENRLNFYGRVER